MTSPKAKGKEKAVDHHDSMDLDYVPFGNLSDGEEKLNKNAKSSGGASQPLPPTAAFYHELRLVPWAELVRWSDCSHVAEMLHYEVLACADWLSALPEEHEVRRLVVEQIRRAVVQNFRGSDVTPFGSFGTNLYLPGGDLDLVVTLPGDVDVVHTLKKIGKMLKQTGIGREIVVISRAKVPIIKFKTIIGGFLVDISINQSNGIAAAALVNRFVAQHPALRYMILIVKLFLSQKNMNEVYTGGLGSYSTICLIINFLQMHPKIRNAEIDPMENLGVILVEFFELYGHHFNYNEVGISLQHGGSYYSKAERGWINPLQRSLLSVEDPQLESNDVATSSREMPRVKRGFATAFETLTASLLLRAGEIEARRSGHHFSFKRDQNADSGSHMSLLKSVVWVDEEFMERRREIMELYHSGALQQMLGEEMLGPPPPPTSPPPAIPPPPRDDLNRSKKSKGKSKATTEKKAKRKREELDYGDPVEDPAPAPKKSRKRTRSQRKKRKQELEALAAQEAASSGAHVKEEDADVKQEAEEVELLINTVKKKRRSKRKSKNKVVDEARNAFWQGKAGDNQEEEGYDYDSN